MGVRSHTIMATWLSMTTTQISAVWAYCYWITTLAKCCGCITCVCNETEGECLLKAKVYLFCVLKFLSIPREQCNNLFIYDSSWKSPHHPWLVLLKQTLQWFNQKCQNFTKIQAQTLNSTYTIVSWFLFIMKFHLYIPEKDKWL